MKGLLLKLLGISQVLWAFVRPLLASKVGTFLADARVQKLALAYVEQAAGLDLDGDGKHEHARAELDKSLRAVGVEYSRSWLSLAVEAAFRQAREQADANGAKR